MQVSSKPVKGMRDFEPLEARLRDHVRQHILKSYQSFGFQYIETPVMENIALLQNAEGGENLNMLFKVLKRGEKLNLDQAVQHENDLVDYGLRFDLTLPLARFYANNHAKLPTPFKSIQMGYVWRAERAQKGRFRQFMQCDIDYLGSASPNVEIELIHVTASTLHALGFKRYRVRLNDRRVLESLANYCGIDASKLGAVLVTLDKLDKIGVDGVKTELAKQTLDDASIDKLMNIIHSFEAGDITLDTLEQHIPSVDENVQKDLQKIMNASEALSKGHYKISFDLSLVRGMGYYTGPIFEIESEDFGSALAGGGRYDNMIGKFLKGRQVPACGFSIGFERILHILSEQNFNIPGEQKQLLVIYDEKEVSDITALFALAEQTRSQGHCVSIEIKQKNVKQQLENFKKLRVDEFAQYRHGDETLSFKDLD